MAYVCQMCGKYAKTKSEIIKHYKKSIIFFFIINRKSLDFKTLLEKANPTLIDSLLDNPNPLIRNVSAQPFEFFSFASFSVMSSSRQTNRQTDQ